MKLKLIQDCITPEGRHKAGSVAEIAEPSASYLVQNGYAKPAMESAELPRQSIETADMPTVKRGRPPKN
jgi:hypothetical protein